MEYGLLIYTIITYLMLWVRYMKELVMLHLQARNQERFRAGEFSWNKGTSINMHLQHEKERFRRENI